MFEWTADVGLVALRQAGFEGTSYFTGPLNELTRGWWVISLPLRPSESSSFWGSASMRSHGSCQAVRGHRWPKGHADLAHSMAADQSSERPWPWN